jgi:hypothetical protein
MCALQSAGIILMSDELVRDWLASVNPIKLSSCSFHFYFPSLLY